jgi:hypothetical protein
LDSGVFVKSMLLVIASLNIPPVTSTLAPTRIAIQTAMVRQGCRLDAMATDSGFNRMWFPPSI